VDHTGRFDKVINSFLDDTGVIVVVFTIVVEEDKNSEAAVIAVVASFSISNNTI
jgi:hypothetical protein